MRKLTLLVITLLFTITGSVNAQLPATGQIIHNSADAAADTVDIYVNGNQFYEDLAFREATPFVPLPAGVQLEVGIAPNDMTVNDTVAAFNVSFSSNENYVIVADGIVSQSGYNPNKDFDLKVKNMARLDANSSGNTDVLIHHGATDAPAVEIRETKETQSSLVGGVSYGNFSNYKELPTNDYALEVLPAGGGSPVARFKAPLSTLGLQDSAITVVASGFLDPSQNSGGPEFGLYAAQPTGGPLVELPKGPITAEAQIIHNSADDAADTVDVYLDGQLAIEDLAFREATAFTELPAAKPIQIGIAPNDQTVDDTVAAFNFNLTENEKYTVVADGIVSGMGYNPNQDFTLNVNPMARTEANTGGNTDVLIHHGSTDAPAVEIRETKETQSQLTGNLAYGDFAGYLELGTNDYVLEVLPASGGDPVARFKAPLSTLGLQDSAITVVASGFLDPSQNSDGPEFGLYAALPEGGPLQALPKGPITAKAQIIHNVADTNVNEVDVYLNGDTTSLQGLGFREATPFFELPANKPVKVGIAPAGTSYGDTVGTFDFNLAENGQYVVVANGIVSGSGYTPSPDFTLHATDSARMEASASGETDLLIHHGSTDAPNVDIEETNQGLGTLAEGVSYGNFTDYLSVPEDNYTIQVNNANSGDEIQSYDVPITNLGVTDSAVTVVASGFAVPQDNSGGPAFGLYVALATGGELTPLSTASGIADNNQLDIGVKTFPNPTTDQVEVKWDQDANIERLDLVTASGQKLNSMNVQGEVRERIAMDHLDNGVYMLQFVQNGQPVKSHTIIKQ